MNNNLKTTKKVFPAVLVLGLALLVCVIAMSCDKYDDTYPINIETTDYCYTYTTDRLKLDTVYLINSLSEWQEFGGLPEDIDFEKYSFVFVMVSSPMWAYQSSAQLTQTSENEYELKADFLLDTADVSDEYYRIVSVIVPKLAENAKIKLTVNKQEKNPALCLINTEWSWYKRDAGGQTGGTYDNEFKSIIRILNQNEDNSINYEIFVEDTLFSIGSFQIQYIRGVKCADINLPHHGTGDCWKFVLDGEICHKEGLAFFDWSVGRRVFYYKKK